MFEALKKKRRPTGLNFRYLVAAFLFGAIIVVFVFLDMNPGHHGVAATGGAAAHVNRKTISLAEVSEAAENLRRNPFFAQFGQTQRGQLEVQALRQLVNLELINQAAESEGLRVTDRQVADSIVNEQFFQENGRFKRERYIGYLQAARKTAGEFESQQRKDLGRRRVELLLGLALRPTDLEIQRQQQLKDLKANAEFVSIPTEEAVKPSSLSAADVTDFLKTPDGEKKTKEYYEANKATEFSTQEEVHARHILIKAEKGDSAAEGKALAKIKEVRARLDKEDFAKVAKEVSEDGGSKAQGGDLGFFGRGRMVPEFDKVAFSLEAKKISEPVQSQFGYHLIQVIEKKEAKTKSFEEARDTIARKLIASQRSEKALDEVRELLKKGDLNAVNQWVQKNGLKWDETGTFTVETESVPKIGFNAEVAETAFQLSPTKPLADRLIRQGPSAYILRYKAPGAVAKDAPGMNGMMGMNGKDEAMKPEMMREIVAEQRRRDAFSRMVDHLNKTAKISYADQFKAEAPN